MSHRALPSFFHYDEKYFELLHAFKAAPGRVVTGRVEAVLPAIATGQSLPSGVAVIPVDIESKPIVVRVTLDDKTLASRLVSGSTVDAAIFTDRLRVTHIIRKIILRQTAIVNYIYPF